MNEENGEQLSDDEVAVETDSKNDDIDDDVDVAADVDNVGDISVEINVEELIAKLEATDDDNVARKREIRGRLEELREQREADSALDSTYNFNLDDDL